MLAHTDEKSISSEKLIEKTQLAPVVLKIGPSLKANPYPYPYTDSELANALSNQFAVLAKEHSQTPLKLSLYDSTLGPESIRILKLFTSILNVTAFDFTRCSLQSVIGFYELIKGSAAIEEMGVFAKDVSQFIPGIAIALRKNILKNLKIDIRSESDMLLLSAVLMDNLTLQRLCLTRLRSHAYSPLLDALVTTQLKTLVLKDSSSDSVEIKAFVAELLTKNTALELIYIVDLNSDDDLTMFIKALEKNTHLKTLNLNLSHVILDKSLKALADCLKVNNTLEMIHLSGADFDKAALQALQANSRVRIDADTILISKPVVAPTVFFAPPPATAAAPAVQQSPSLPVAKQTMK